MLDLIAFAVVGVLSAVGGVCVGRDLLARENRRLRRTVRELEADLAAARSFAAGLAERVAAQSALLSRRAEPQPTRGA